MSMDGLNASAVTDDDIAAISQGLAELMDGVKASDISKVEVTDASSSSSRRRSRKLLGMTAKISFTVSMSLAESSFSNATDLLSTVSSTLASVQSNSTALIAKIKAAATSSAKWDTVTGVSGVNIVVMTRPPTASPSSVPTETYPPTYRPTEEEAGGIIFVAFIGAAILLLGLCLFRLRKKRSVLAKIVAVESVVDDLRAAVNLHSSTTASLVGADKQRMVLAKIAAVESAMQDLRAAAATVTNDVSQGDALNTPAEGHVSGPMTPDPADAAAAASAPSTEPSAQRLLLGRKAGGLHTPPAGRRPKLETIAPIYPMSGGTTIARMGQGGPSVAATSTTITTTTTHHHDQSPQYGP